MAVGKKNYIYFIKFALLHMVKERYVPTMAIMLWFSLCRWACESDLFKKNHSWYRVWNCSLHIINLAIYHLPMLVGNILAGAYEWIC